MAAKAGAVALPRSVTFAAGLAGFLLAGAVLYWAQAILIPIALAVLLTFLLSPPVIRLQRLGLPKIVAVLVVAALAFGVIAGIGVLVGAQVLALADELPDHQRKIEDKLRDVRALQKGGVFERVGRVFSEASEKVEKEAEARAEANGDGSEEILWGFGPVPVRVLAEETVIPASLATFVAPLLAPLATAGLVAVLVLFMLLKREDLRNRIVTMSGRANLAVTTKALDEAGQRISRYLLMQFVINVTYGLAMALGTFLLGVDYAVLWGVAAAVFRYIPYVGPWVAAALPIGYSLVTGPDLGPPLGTWGQPVGVVALVVVLELLSNNVMEPLLYGRGVGISEVAVILSAIFWGWLWGPVGLVLATPLTACLVVAGRYVPALSLFNRILGDAPEVEPHVVYYQRLLARDEDEAEDVLEEFTAAKSLTDAVEQVVVPALESTKRDRMRDLIDAAQEQFILEAVQEHVRELSAQATPAAAADGEGPLVYGYGARDLEDEVAATMLRHVLTDCRCRYEVLSRDRLLSEVIEELRESGAVGLCVVALPPGGLAQLRGLCKRVRTALPELAIAVGRWGPALPEKHLALLREHGATYVGRTPSETRGHVTSMARLQPAASEPGPSPAGQAVAV